MRATLDISEREHALFTTLAREKRTSFSKLVVESALRGLQTPSVADAPATYALDKETGLPVFRSGRPVTLDRGLAALHDDVAELISTHRKSVTGTRSAT